MAVLSLFLSKVGQTKFAFFLFTLYVNLSIFYFCKYHPFETQNYLYYFPLIVSVVLLTNASFKDKLSLTHLGICLLFFIATFTIEIPGLQLDLTQEKIDFLRIFNIVTAAIITMALSFLLTRLISRQNAAIVTQNIDLLKAKAVVNASLKEKEVLLAELHHRVKNNLAIISGLLNMQGDATSNEEAKEIIGDTKTRIMSMALVHRMLYDNPELKSLDLGKYISELVIELLNSYSLARKVSLTQDCEKLVLPVSKSIPLGLIINEIVTNSIKYVFRSSTLEKGHFFISIKERANLVTMVVRDHGDGFPENFDSNAENLSLGIYLIKSLTAQIDGTVRFANDNGAKVEMRFPLH